MSDPAKSSNLEQEIETGISDAAPIVATIVSVMFPEAATIAGISAKIAQGVVAGIPEAKALYAEIMSDNPPTASQLEADIADDNTAYAKAIADIDAKLKAAGAA